MNSLTEILIACENEGIPTREIMQDISQKDYTYIKMLTKLRSYYVHNLLNQEYKKENYKGDNYEKHYS